MLNSSEGVNTDGIRRSSTEGNEPTRTSSKENGYNGAGNSEGNAGVSIRQIDSTNVKNNGLVENSFSVEVNGTSKDFNQLTNSDENINKPKRIIMKSNLTQEQIHQMEMGITR